jgi:hypothetical protein
MRHRFSGSELVHHEDSDVVVARSLLSHFSAPGVFAVCL